MTWLKAMVSRILWARPLASRAPRRSGPGPRSERCALWLEDLARSRDLTSPLRGVDEALFPLAATLRRFVAELSDEMLDFRAVVEAAAKVAARTECFDIILGRAFRCAGRPPRPPFPM